MDVCCRLLLLLQWIYGGNYLSQCSHFQHFWQMLERVPIEFQFIYPIQKVSNGVFSYTSSALQFCSGNNHIHFRGNGRKWIEKKVRFTISITPNSVTISHPLSSYTHSVSACVILPAVQNSTISRLVKFFISSRFICGVGGGGGSVNANNGACVNNRLRHDRFEWS